MAVIRPFRGLRYDRSRVGPLERVLCPPYDVVDEAERARLTALSPYNLIRVELPQERPSVAATPEDYARAAETLARWEAEGALLRDGKPSVYPYSQRFVGPDGKTRERRGFLTLLRVEDYDGGAVRPHEKTLPKPKEDRFNLLRSTSTNVSPVFGLFDDRDGRASEVLARACAGAPLAEIVDGKGIEHRVWRIEDGEALGGVRAALTEARIYIADGHHRYETAIRYRNARREAESVRPPIGTAPYDFTLAYLSDLRDPGLAVFPIHRLAKIPPGLTPAAARAALERFFVVEEIAGVEAAPPGSAASAPEATAAALEAAIQPFAGRKEKAFGLFAPSWRAAWLLRAKGDELTRFLLQAGVVRPVAALDVVALHRAILEEVFAATYAEGSVHFAHSAADAVRIVLGKGTGAGDAAHFGAAILCNATKVSEMVAVVDAAETMPQKSTFFYPKPATGVVMNRLDE